MLPLPFTKIPAMDFRDLNSFFPKSAVPLICTSLLCTPKCEIMPDLWRI